MSKCNLILALHTSVPTKLRCKYKSLTWTYLPTHLCVPTIRISHLLITLMPSQLILSRQLFFAQWVFQKGTILRCKK